MSSYSTHFNQNFTNQDHEESAETRKENNTNEQTRKNQKKYNREADQVNDGVDNGEEEHEAKFCKTRYIFLNTPKYANKNRVKNKVRKGDAIQSELKKPSMY